MVTLKLSTVRKPTQRMEATAGASKLQLHTALALISSKVYYKWNLSKKRLNSKRTFRMLKEASKLIVNLIKPAALIVTELD